jgi:hypothetical protein
MGKVDLCVEDEPQESPVYLRADLARCILDGASLESARVRICSVVYRWGQCRTHKQESKSTRIGGGDKKFVSCSWFCFSNVLRLS